MILFVAATVMEMTPLRARLKADAPALFLVSGVGPVETGIQVSRFLADHAGEIDLLVNFGVAGAYLDTGIKLLDICVARQENLGDLGICFDNDIRAFDDPLLSVGSRVELDCRLVDSAVSVFSAQGIDIQAGNFVTVCGGSGTARRGNLLRDRFGAICENMEGAAVARAAALMGIRFLELRCVSNLVEDRNPQNWQLEKAATLCADAASRLVSRLDAILA